MAKYRCKVCGYIHEGEMNADFVCPKCKKPASYEFGIMENLPENGRRYDDYDPENYPRLVAVEDDDFDPFLGEFKGTVYWHTLDMKGEEIAMVGVNLIPPESSAIIADMITGNDKLQVLKKLLTEAVSENRFVILFGL